MISTSTRHGDRGTSRSPFTGDFPPEYPEIQSNHESRESSRSPFAGDFPPSLSYGRLRGAEEESIIGVRQRRSGSSVFGVQDTEEARRGKEKRKWKGETVRLEVWLEKMEILLEKMKVWPEKNEGFAPLLLRKFSRTVRPLNAIGFLGFSVMAVLNWKHHTLIQSLMMRGPLCEADFLKIFSGVTGINPRSNDREFNDALLNINKELSYIQMELRCCRNQNDGNVCYGLVNNVSDEQSKLGTKYSVPQIAFFKSIIEAIISDTTAQGTICTFDALNLRLEVQVNCGAESQSQLQSQSEFGSQVHPALRNFSLSQKEKTLDELVQDKWLCRTTDAKIGLGERSYLELRSVFHNSATPICEVCNEAAIKAYMCKNEECAVRIHHYCLTKKFSGSRGNVACPTCGIQWDCQFNKSEHLEANDEQHELTETGSKRKRRKAFRVADSADADGGSSSQASQSVSDLRRTTRLSSRTR